MSTTLAGGLRLISRPGAPRRPPAENERVLISVASRGCNRTVRRAVVSLLEQSHRDLVVVVTSDGDGGGPRRALRSVADRRLVQLELGKSYGPYFAHDLVLRAGDDFSYFAVQDADDESSPQRLATLLRAIKTTGADAAFCEVLDRAPDGAQRLSRARRWTAVGMPLLAEHFGLYRRSSVLSVGGYYGGVKVGYDQFITSTMAAFCRCAVVPKALYYRYVRPDSLTRSPMTGWGSPLRKSVTVSLQRRYAAVLRNPAMLGGLRLAYVPRRERRLIDGLARDLRGRLLGALRGAR